MTPELTGSGLHGVLLDIEGTTTPIAFVHDVLFPFARAHLAHFLQSAQGSEEFGDIVRRLAAGHAEDVRAGEHPPPWKAGVDDELATVSAYVHWLMDRDRKSPGLKLLQGLIWERGYQAGSLRGQVFADVPPAIRRWRARGLEVAIYSSGSELAQRRLFESTAHGDLTPFIRGFFDTAVGPKRSADSYRRIAGTLGRPPAALLFVSDVTAELAAARDAGMAVVLSERPGNPAQPDADAYERISSFDEIP